MKTILSLKHYLINLKISQFAIFRRQHIHVLPIIQLKLYKIYIYLLLCIQIGMKISRNNNASFTYLLCNPNKKYM